MKANVKKVQLAKDFIEKRIKSECDKARNIGIAAGAKTIATVIMDIINSDNLSSEEKLAKITNFCGTCLTNPIESDLKAQNKGDKNE